VGARVNLRRGRVVYLYRLRNSGFLFLRAGDGIESVSNVLAVWHTRGRLHVKNTERSGLDTPPQNLSIRPYPFLTF